MSDDPRTHLVTLHGPPIEDQTQQLFGGWGGKVTGVLITSNGITVSYASGAQLTFIPTSLPCASFTGRPH